MDIQKERELCGIEFEKEWDSFCEAYGNKYDKSVAKFFYFEAWQAKAQAVPEGFVLVPKEPTLEMCHRGRNTRSFKVQDIYKAMIEAQEQN